MVKYRIENLKNVLSDIPESLGFFVCLNNDFPVFFKTTENLRKFVSLYLLEETEEISLIDLRNNSNNVQIVPCNDLLEAYIEELLFIDQYNPSFNQSIKPWVDYSYLSLQWKVVPFIKISDNTLDDSAFIGPFRDKFFLHDLIETFNSLYKLPACKDDDFPCDLKDEGHCAGYCIYDNHLDTAEILMNFYLLPNINILKDLKKRIHLLEVDLLFEEAEIMLLKKQFIEKYYRQLLFFYTSRFINKTLKVQDFSVIIENGMIKNIKKKNHLIYTNHVEDFPRDNELLCFNKHETDQRWIVFRTIEKSEPKYLQSLLKENYQDIQARIFNFINQDSK